MDRQLTHLQESLGPAAARSLSACSFPATAAASGLPLSCRAWRALCIAEDQGGGVICCSMRGAGVVTWAVASVGLPLLKLGTCVLPCVVITPLGVESWEEAGFGVEVSHGLLLAKVCGAGIPQSPIPPAWNVK